MTIGVVVCTYRSADVITDCLDALLASDGADLRVLICDNASPDGTAEVVRNWAAAQAVGFAEYAGSEAAGLSYAEIAPFTLIHTGDNLGFAGGVNTGLRALIPHAEIDLFWVLNPDAAPDPDAAAIFAARNTELGGAFSLMGGRVIYEDAPGVLQADGGLVHPLTGVCSCVNQGLLPEDAPLPDAASFNFITGASMLASRAFIDRVGPMEEDYFLYYEEVDWAYQRGDLPLVYAPGAVTRHKGGTSIGTGSVSRRPSAFANYFNYRGRMMFLRRFNRKALPTALAFAMAKVGQLCLYGAFDEALGAFRGALGLSPPRAVRQKLSPSAARIAFGRQVEA